MEQTFHSRISLLLKMKQVVKILFLISIAFAQDEEATTLAAVSESEAAVTETATTLGSESETSAAPSDCHPWPSHLKSIRECCSIPSHYNGLTQNICISKCSMKHGEARTDCELVCYVNQTALIQDEKINKLVVQRIYENNAFHERRWSNIINDGIQKCEYVATGSLMGDLMKFYNCVNDYLSENCIIFMQTNECDATEEHFLKCKNIEPNCSAWPIHQMRPDACCKTFPLISEALTAKCRRDCQRKELFYNRQHECVHNCTHIETGMIVDKKIDFEVVKKMLIESSKHSLEWEKPIEIAVENCEKLVKGREIIYDLLRKI